MYPTSMRINEEGRLVVNFKTEARFRGQFVMSHPGKGSLSLIHIQEGVQLVMLTGSPQDVSPIELQIDFSCYIRPATQ